MDESLKILKNHSSELKDWVLLYGKITSKLFSTYENSLNVSNLCFFLFSNFMNNLGSKSKIMQRFIISFNQI